MPQVLNRLLDPIWVLKKLWQPSVAQEGQPTSWALSVKDKEQLSVRVSYKTEPDSAKTTYKLNLYLWYPAELSPVHMDLWGRIWQSVLLHTQKVSLEALACQHGPAALPLTMIDDLKAAQGKCSWFSSQKATAEIQRLQQALVQQLRLHACIYRSALRRASKPVCAALEEWAQQDGSSRTELALHQLAAQIQELVTQLEQAVANLKQVHKACCSNGMPAAVQQACLVCLEFIHYEAEQALLRVLQAGLHCSESNAAQPQAGSVRKISQDLRDSSRPHVAAVRSTLRLKHPLDMRMPLLFDDGPSSSTPSHNSTSRDSRSSVFGEIAAPTSQGVPAETWRSSEAGSHDRALWGSEALMEAPDMQNAQRLVGESICSLQERSRQMGFAGCNLQSTDSLATEQYTTWLKNLKRSVKSAMSLKAKVRPPSQLLADVVGSCVAAIAMGWAILSVYIGQRLIGVNLHTGPNQLYAPVFLLCVIVGYVIKDRMKEFGKRYLRPAAKRCGVYFPDRVIELLDHHSAVVGSCKEDCKVIDERSVNPKIRELRHVAPQGPQWLPSAEELQPELVMVYSKKMQVRWRQLQGLPQVGLDDTMKFDLSPLCRHMQPEAEPHYRVLRDGGGRFKVEEVECSRAYRLHLVLQVQSEAPAGATTQLQKACVVMDRTGIKRLELR